MAIGLSHDKVNIPLKEMTQWMEWMSEVFIQKFLVPELARWSGSSNG
jgi:hypothetical protein